MSLIVWLLEFFLAMLLDVSNYFSKYKVIITNKNGIQSYKNKTIKINAFNLSYTPFPKTGFCHQASLVGMETNSVFNRK